jgi:fibronectin type 3 domain-containing protein
MAQAISLAPSLGSHGKGGSAQLTAQSTIQVFEPDVPAAGSLPSAGGLPAAVSYPTPIPGTMSPAKIQEAYGFNNVLLPGGASATGAGETIAIVDAFDDPNIQSDLHTFDQQYFGGVDPVFTKINLGATATINSPEEWELEESLDVEWAHAVAPQANITLVEAATNSMTDLLAAVDKAVSTGAPVVSMSWGLNGGESSTETTWDSHFAVPNVAFVASSGDVGAPAMWPAASPGVIGVGGTSLALNASNDWSSEVGWFDGGGGISLYETRPAVQPTTYSNGATTGIALPKRGVPDVAYDAARESAMSVFDSFPHSKPSVFNGTQTGWFAVGGTSAGAPQWAALIALADQGRAQAGTAPLGTAATLSALYANPADFHDILSGTSVGIPNYTAGPGYDLVTGLGSPQAPLVVSFLIGIAPTTAPSTPTGLWVVPTDGQVSLSWNATSGATSWNVYRSTDGVTFNLGASVTGTSFTDSGLTDGVSYFYQVSAVNAVGESAPAAPVSTTPQIPPAPPTLQSATPSNNTFGQPDFSFAVTLQWAASSGATSYDVLRSETSGGGYAVVASGVTATSYTDTSVYAASTFYYVVRAVNAAGARSGYSAQLSAKTIPSAPANLTATSGRAQVALAWSATTGATSYNVLRSTTNGSGYVTIATGITGTSFTNTGLTNGVTYYYVIQAVDSSGPSADSNQASATPSKNGR